MKDKKEYVNIKEAAEAAKFDVNDLMMYIAREEARHGNGWLAKGLAVPGAILLPGASQVVLVERYVKIAKTYFRAKNIPVRDKDLRQFLTRNCTTPMVMIWENPKAFVEEYPKLIGAQIADEKSEDKKEES